jgi:hypothetical protein
MGQHARDAFDIRIAINNQKIAYCVFVFTIIAVICGAIQAYAAVCMMCHPRMTKRIAIRPKHVYEVRPRKHKRGVDLISDVLPFGRLWYGEPNAISNRIGYPIQPQNT